MRSLAQRAAWHFPKLRFLLIHRVFAAVPEKKEILAWQDSLSIVSENNLQNISVVCITKRQWLGRRVLKLIKGFETKILDGSNAKSFSELCNLAILRSQSELVVITSDKCFPKTRTIYEMQRLLSGGYGLVCAYRFGCFGISKSALSKVGFMDENFSGGGYEDTDFLLRFWEADIAVIETESIPYFPLPSLWKIASPSDRFNLKWTLVKGGYPKRLLSEDSRHEQIISTEIELLPFRNSRLCDESISTGIKFFD